MFYSDYVHDPEVAQWVFRLMHDPEYYEQWRFKNTIDEYNNLIADCQKQYEQTPLWDQYTRAKLITVIRECKRDLAKTELEYRVFQRYKIRTSIQK